MILSYKVDPFGSSEKRKKIRATITTRRPASHYGLPVIVLSDGEAIDLISWIGCNYRVERATKKEMEKVNKILSPFSLLEEK